MSISDFAILIYIISLDGQKAEEKVCVGDEEQKGMHQISVDNLTSSLLTKRAGLRVNADPDLFWFFFPCLKKRWHCEIWLVRFTAENRTEDLLHYFIPTFSRCKTASFWNVSSSNLWVIAKLGLSALNSWFTSRIPPLTAQSCSGFAFFVMVGAPGKRGLVMGFWFCVEAMGPCIRASAMESSAWYKTSS